jgi:hypothetical protein
MVLQLLYRYKEAIYSYQSTYDNKFDKFYLQYISVTTHCTVKPAFNAEVNNQSADQDICPL